MTRAPANTSAGTTWQALHQHAEDDGFRGRSTHPCRASPTPRRFDELLTLAVLSPFTGWDATGA